MLKKTLKTISLWFLLFLVFILQILIFDVLLDFDINLTLVGKAIDISFVASIAVSIYIYKINIFEKIKKPTLKQFFITIGIAILFSFVSHNLNLKLLFDSSVKQSVSFPVFDFYFEFRYNYFSYDFLRIIIFVPILEEFFYRYILQDKFIEVTTPFLSVLVTSILFSVFHLDIDNFLMYLIAGFILGYTYFYTQNLLISIFMHMSINSIIKFTKLSYDIDNINLGLCIIFFILTIIFILIKSFKIVR